MIFATGPDNVAITRDEFIKNLELKKDNQGFQLDMDFLLPQYRDWDYKKAYQFVIDNIIEKLP